MKKLIATTLLAAAVYATWREWSAAASDEDARERADAMLNDSTCCGSWQD